MQERPYYALMDKICRSNGWVLGQDKGLMVLGVPTDDGKQQSLVVEEFADTTGQLALRLWSPVAPASKLPADQALQINAQLPHGALGIKDGQAIVVATRVLNLTSQADLTQLIATLTHFARFYARHFGG